MAEVDPGFFRAAARRIVDLINSQPQSPTIEEIEDDQEWHESPVMEVEANWMFTPKVSK